MAPTAKDIYIKQFSGLGKGVPLYEPCKVHVGDVGFIDPHDGFFVKLYNIADPPRNRKRGCPPPIKLKRADYKRDWGPIHVKTSKELGVSSQVTTPEGQIQIVFSEVKHGECILIPGDVVVLERLEETVGLPKYMNDHLNWIRNTYASRHAFSPQSLILVARTTKTNRWAIAVNTSSKVFGKLSFNVASAGATVWGDWSTWSIISSSGPKPVTEDADETIFMRCIALCPSISFFGKRRFGFSRDSKPTTFHRLRATMAINKPDQWAEPEPEDTQSLPAATTGAGSANIEEGNDEE